MPFIREKAAFREKNSEANREGGPSQLSRFNPPLVLNTKTFTSCQGQSFTIILQHTQNFIIIIIM